MKNENGIGYIGEGEVTRSLSQFLYILRVSFPLFSRVSIQYKTHLKILLTIG